MISILLTSFFEKRRRTPRAREMHRQLGLYILKFLLSPCSQCWWPRLQKHYPVKRKKIAFASYLCEDSNLFMFHPYQCIEQALDSLFTMEACIFFRTITFESKWEVGILTDSTILTEPGGFGVHVAATKVKFTPPSEEASITVALEFCLVFPCSLQADAMA